VCERAQSKAQQTMDLLETLPAQVLVQVLKQATAQV
jgi:hypothetical protein